MDSLSLGSEVLHYCGILGALLMVSAMAYSVKKRFGILKGNRAFWLKYHRRASLTGFLLVLIHTGGEVRGIAGLSLILTACVILFGLLGVNVQTRILKSRGGAVKELADIRKEIASMSGGHAIGNKAAMERKADTLQAKVDRLGSIRSVLSGWRSWHTHIAGLLLVSLVIHVASILYFGGPFW